MADDLSKSSIQEIKDLKAQVEALNKAVKALLVAAAEWNDVTGRDCMPEGDYLGVKF